MRNLSLLFSRKQNGFIGNLDLTIEQKEIISDAKNKIKDYLRSGITIAIKEQYGVVLAPRFRSQGSAVYKTRNQPCLTPPQQIDHDIGCYLPLSILKDSGNPSIAADVFFGIVDELLAELVKREKWKNIETKKKTCSRVVVTQNVHIDVPLYSIPDDQFHTVNDSMEARNFSLSEAVSKSLDWDSYEIKTVLLAHRELNWKPSDPGKLNKYFSDVFIDKGEQLRRICRYLKAWRDYKWSDGGPSSIFLMVLADSIYTSEIEPRDDLALLALLNAIPQKLQSPVVNPADSNEKINISQEDMDKLADYSRDFKSDLEKAINDSSINSREACALIQKNLGDRFPIDLTIIFDPEATRKIVLSTQITNEPNRKPNDRGRAG